MNAFITLVGNTPFELTGQLQDFTKREQIVSYHDQPGFMWRKIEWIQYIPFGEQFTAIVGYTTKYNMMDGKGWVDEIERP